MYRNCSVKPTTYTAVLSYICTWICVLTNLCTTIMFSPVFRSRLRLPREQTYHSYQSACQPSWKRLISIENLKRGASWGRTKHSCYSTQSSRLTLSGRFKLSSNSILQARQPGRVCLDRATCGRKDKSKHRNRSKRHFGNTGNLIVFQIQSLRLRWNATHGGATAA